MKELEVARQAQAAATRRTLGVPGAMPLLMAREISGALFASEHVRLPSAYGRPQFDLDPASPTFGKPYFTPGYDDPSNPDGLPLAPP